MYLLMAISVLALALMLAVIRGRAEQVKDPRSAGAILLPVDIESFRNLIDPTQDRFLRQRLSNGDYRRVQRARSLAVADYLRKVAHNASVLLRLGEAARDNADPAVAAMGAAMVSSAINVRLNCVLGLARAYTRFVFPDVAISVASIADRYDRLSATLGTIGRSWTHAPNVNATV